VPGVCGVQGTTTISDTYSYELISPPDFSLNTPGRGDISFNFQAVDNAVTLDDFCLRIVGVRVEALTALVRPPSDIVLDTHWLCV
jgi:hypothetical protein